MTEPVDTLIVGSHVVTMNPTRDVILDGASSAGASDGRSGGASGAGGGVAARPSVSTSNVMSPGRRPCRTAWTI